MLPGKKEKKNAKDVCVKENLIVFFLIYRVYYKTLFLLPCQENCTLNQTRKISPISACRHLIYRRGVKGGRFHRILWLSRFTFSLNPILGPYL